VTSEQIRKLSDEELQEELSKSQKELMTLRFSAAAKQLADPNQLRSMRKQVARIMTIQTERKIIKEANG
jgi:large subunit ribosomal protein L29